MGKRGPQPKDEADKRSAIGIRLPPALLKQLENAKASSGARTLTEEIERRLQESFNPDQKVDERFHGRKNFWFALLIADGIAEWIEKTAQVKWWDDPFAFDEATRLINAVLQELRPPGKGLVPKHLQPQRIAVRHIGETTPKDHGKVLLPAPFAKKGALGEWVAHVMLTHHQLAAKGPMLLGHDQQSQNIRAATGNSTAWRDTLVSQLGKSGQSPFAYFGGDEAGNTSSKNRKPTGSRRQRSTK